MNDFVEHCYLGICSPLLKGSPAEAFLHLGHTVICGVVVLNPPDSSTLDHLDLMNTLLSVRAPYSGCILYLRSYQSFISTLLDVLPSSLDVAP